MTFDFLNRSDDADLDFLQQLCQWPQVYDTSVTSKQSLLPIRTIIWNYLDDIMGFESGMNS